MKTLGRHAQANCASTIARHERPPDVTQMATSALARASQSERSNPQEARLSSPTPQAGTAQAASCASSMARASRAALASRHARRQRPRLAASGTGTALPIWRCLLCTVP